MYHDRLLGIAYDFRASLATGTLLAIILFHLARVYWRLRSFPGPFWARFTNVQRVYWVQSTRSHIIHEEMHKHYGDFVRFGPNMVSISDPSLIPDVYPVRRGLPKGSFYRSLMPYSRHGSAQPLVFNTRDETLHMQMKKPIAPLFSLSNILSYEKFVDDVTQQLFEQFDRRFVEEGIIFDLGEWFQYFAFEVMGTMTFSRRYGFLHQGHDNNGLIWAIWNFMKTAAPITQIPWVDLVLYKNPIAAYLRPTTGMPILKIVRESIEERRKATPDGKRVDGECTMQGDFLSRFLQVQKDDPSVPAWTVTAWTFSNVIAGSDSTASVMKTLWYNLLSHPDSMSLLYKELLQAKLSRPYPRWTEIAALPYLDACINEAVRLHPPFCLPLERVVPEGGLEIGGRFIPGGTVIGMNPWVLNHHKPTFGDDAHEWRPERWLGDSDKYRMMEQAVLTFGAGRRICLGRYIAILELKKITSALALNYMASPITSPSVKISSTGTYEVENRWFFRQWGLNVTIQKYA
ncbi:cytochrome P450 CYP4/CYP19/CYP26 subfamily [Xylariaceae sp. FL1651]|nr:cytochrome P450 CYP4/CYP19/CYP26 subfamily [Xylariaceae sp. FL1651]